MQINFKNLESPSKTFYRKHLLTSFLSHNYNEIINEFESDVNLKDLTIKALNFILSTNFNSESLSEIANLTNSHPIFNYECLVALTFCLKLQMSFWVTLDTSSNKLGFKQYWQTLLVRLKAIINLHIQNSSLKESQKMQDTIVIICFKDFGLVLISHYYPFEYKLLLALAKITPFASIDNLIAKLLNNVTSLRLVSHSEILLEFLKSWQFPDKYLAPLGNDADFSIIKRVESYNLKGKIIHNSQINIDALQTALS